MSRSGEGLNLGNRRELAMRALHVVFVASLSGVGATSSPFCESWRAFLIMS